jgi:hypothetical protein
MSSTAPNSNQNTEFENDDYDEKEIVNIVRNGSRLLLRRDAVQAMLTCMRQPSLSGWKSCEFTTRREPVLSARSQIPRYIWVPTWILALDTHLA